MKKKKIIYAILAEAVFLNTLTACNNDILPSSIDDATTEIVENTSTKDEETTTDSITILYEKVFNELKNSFSDISYDEFKDNVFMIEFEDKIKFDYFQSCITLDLNGEFLKKVISIEENSNVMNQTCYIYMDNEWIIERISKFINDEEHVYYILGFYSFDFVYYKYESTFDEKGNLLNNIESKLVNNKWIYSDKDEYTYDENGKLLTFKESKFIKNEWIKTKEYKYLNNKETLIFKIDLKEDDSFDLKYDYTYDENGKLLTCKESKFINNEWIKIEEYGYKNNLYRPIYEITLNIDDTFNLKYEYTYDDNGNLLKMTAAKFINNEWVIYQESNYILEKWYDEYYISFNQDGSFAAKYDYVYDDSLRLTTKTTSSYVNNEWVIIENHKYFYRDSYSTSKPIYLLDLNNNEKTIYTYDDNANLLNKVTFKYLNSTWIKVKEDIYARNEDGSTTTIIEYVYDENENILSEAHYENYMWNIDYKIEYTYTDENVIKEVSYYNDKHLIIKKDTYDNETLKSRIIYDEDGSFKTKKEYEYFDNTYYVTKYQYINNQWVDIEKYIFDNGLGLPLYKKTVASNGKYISMNEYAFDEKHNITLDMRSKYVHNSFFYDYYFTYTYDENNSLISKTKYRYINNAWERIEEYAYLNNKELVLYCVVETHGRYTDKFEYTFDDNGKYLLDIWSKYENDSWVPYLKSEAIYENNNIKINNIYDYNNGAWVLSSKTEYIFNENDQFTSYISSKYENGEWVFDYKEEVTYDSYGKKVNQTYSNFKDGAFVPYRKYEVICDTNGNILSEETSNCNSGNWVFEHRYEYTYDENENLLSKILYSYSSGKLTSKTEYTYDIYGNILSLIYSKYLEEQLVYDFKYEYTYNENNNKLTETRFNFKDEQWVLSYSEEYTYDENNNMLSKIMRNYYEDQVSVYKYEYTYDDSGRILSETKYKDYSLWKIEYKYEYTYDDFGVKFQKVDGAWVLVI